MTQLIKINASDYGLEENKAKQISEMFKPMLDAMVELENEFNQVSKLDISKQETSLKAAELRKKYVKVRTGTAKIHKELKAFYLQGGRFVDGWKNAQLMASQGIEDKLSEIENYRINLEKQRIADLQSERAEIISKYSETILENLGQMSDDVWNNFLTGTKTNFEARIAAEKLQEEQRIAAEKAEIERQKAIEAENKKLKLEAEKAAKAAEAERKERERLAKIEQDKRDAERKEYEAKLKLEAEKAAKIQAELKAKQDAELKAKEDAEAKRQAELNAGDSKKFDMLIEDLESIKTKYEFKSEKNKKRYADISILIDKIINHVR